MLLQVSRAGQMVCKTLCVVINCPVACSCKPDTGAAHHESKHAWVQDECLLAASALVDIIRKALSGPATHEPLTSWPPTQPHSQTGPPHPSAPLLHPALPPSRLLPLSFQAPVLAGLSGEHEQ